MKRLIESARVEFMYFLARLVKALARKGEYCPCCWGARLVMEFCSRCDRNLSDSELDKGYVVCRSCDWEMAESPHCIDDPDTVRGEFDVSRA